MADLSTGVPERVWSKAVVLGMHPECVSSALPCERCEQHLMESFEAVYGGAQSMDEVIGMIAFDLATDKAKELAA